MGKLRVLIPSLVVCFSLATAQTRLQLGTPIERTLGPGQVHEFTVNLEENNFIQFVVEQRGIDLFVKVSSPAGKNGEYDTPNPEGPENVSPLPQALTASRSAHSGPTIRPRAVTRSSARVAKPRTNQGKQESRRSEGKRHRTAGGDRNYHCGNQIASESHSGPTQGRRVVLKSTKSAPPGSWQTRLPA